MSEGGIGLNKRRVLLLDTQPLLGKGLELILNQLEDVELIGPWDLDRPVLSRLAKQGPDIVLVAEDQEQSRRLTALIGRILERYPDLPVIRIGLERNRLRLYCSRSLPAHSANLIELIRSLPVKRKGE